MSRKQQPVMRRSTHITHQIHDPDARDQSHIDFAEQSAFIGILTGIGPRAIFDMGERRRMFLFGFNLAGHDGVCCAENESRTE